MLASSMDPERLRALAKSCRAYFAGDRDAVPPGLCEVLDELTSPTGGAFPVAERIVETAGELSVTLALADDDRAERGAVARAAVAHGIRVLAALIERGYEVGELEQVLDGLLASPKT